MSNTIYLIVGASGTGKTTLVANTRQVLAMDGIKVHEAVSTTTRDRRPGERQGVTYHFVTKELFEQLDADGALCERVDFAGNLYGIQRAHIEGPLAEGDVFIIVEPSGAEQLCSLYPEQTVVVWVEAAGEEELRRRMIERARDSDGNVPEAELAKIEGRLENDRVAFTWGVIPWNLMLSQGTPSEMATRFANMVRSGLAARIVQARHSAA